MTQWIRQRGSSPRHSFVVISCWKSLSVPWTETTNFLGPLFPNPQKGREVKYGEITRGVLRALVIKNLESILVMVNFMYQLG